MFKIVLDAGHGRYTAGKRCLKSLDINETREWVLNDRICDKVQEKLKKYNDCSVLRVDDTTGKEDIPLTDRVNSANAFGADLYLSVHHNAGINGGVGGGIIAIVDTNADDIEKSYQNIIYSKLIEYTGLKGNRSNPTPKQDLYVLKYTKMPAVLVECGFMDSKTDVPIILSEEFADNCAKSLTESIVEIGNLKLKNNSIGFEDTKGHYAEQAINDLKEFGIVNGIDNSHYAPNDYLTRADIAIIARNLIRYITGK